LPPTKLLQHGKFLRKHTIFRQCSSLRKASTEASKETIKSEDKLSDGLNEKRKLNI